MITLYIAFGKLPLRECVSFFTWHLRTAILRSGNMAGHNFLYDFEIAFEISSSRDATAMLSPVLERRSSSHLGCLLKPVPGQHSKKALLMVTTRQLLAKCPKERAWLLSFKGRIPELKFVVVPMHDPTLAVKLVCIAPPIAKVVRALIFLETQQIHVRFRILLSLQKSIAH